MPLIARKRWWLLPLSLLLLVGIGVVWKQRQVERDALALAGAGRDALKLFKAYGAALKTSDWPALNALYSVDYRDDHGPRLWQLVPLEQEPDLVTADIRADQQTSRHRDDVLACVRTFRQQFGHLSTAKMKLARVSKHDERHMALAAVLWLVGQREDGWNMEAQVKLKLELKHGDQGWQISGQRFEGGTASYGPGKGFANVAEQAGLDFQARLNPIHQTPEWQLDLYGIFKYASAGVSSADYDGDGYYDLLFADGAEFALYRNLGTGQFERVTRAVGLEPEGGYQASLFVDLDNDGWQDLVLAGLTRPSRFYRNLGNGHFEGIEPVDTPLGPLVTNVAAADYDNDGDLDLYLGRYLDPRIDLPTTLFYTRNGAGNTLLRNDGNWHFVDVTEEAGVREGGLTLGISWGDYDADGDQDLYVANDFGRNALFENRGDGTFTDVTAASGTFDFGFGMSATFGDIDNDGDLDLYTSNVHSGQRWYGQAATLYQYLINSVKQGTATRDFPIYREIVAYTGANWRDYGDAMVKGNSLMLNDGKGRFTDISESAGANPFGWFWGSTMFDYDNDGLLDLYAANGWISGETVDDL